MNEHMSMGEHIFRFKIALGTVADVRRALPLLSDDLTLPFSYLCNIPLDASEQPGAERGTELVQLEAQGNVHVEAIKRSEDGEALVVRLAERGGTEATATLSLLDCAPLTTTFKPYQMKTLRFQREGSEALVRECDLLERPVGGWRSAQCR